MNPIHHISCIVHPAFLPIAKFHYMSCLLTHIHHYAHSAYNISILCANISGFNPHTQHPIDIPLVCCADLGALAEMPVTDRDINHSIHLIHCSIELLCNISVSCRNLLFILFVHTAMISVKFTNCKRKICVVTTT